MKRGDKIPVTIAGQTVANAEVREVGDGQVTLVVPGTLVVMATRTEIAYEAPTQPERETETVITGVDRSSGETVDVETAPARSAPVGETNETNDTTQGQDTTPTPEVSTVEATEVAEVSETPVGEPSTVAEDSGSTGETGGNPEAS